MLSEALLPTYSIVRGFTYFMYRNMTEMQGAIIQGCRGWKSYFTGVPWAKKRKEKKFTKFQSHCSNVFVFLVCCHNCAFKQHTLNASHSQWKSETGLQIAGGECDGLQIKQELDSAYMSAPMALRHIYQSQLEHCFVSLFPFPWLLPLSPESPWFRLNGGRILFFRLSFVFTL